jgi:hypothetical protein
MNRLWETISFGQMHPEGKDVRVETFNYLLKMAVKSQFITDYSGHRYCVIDECLIQNISIMSKYKSNRTIKEKISESLDYYDRSTVVINFQMEEEELFNRLLSRGSVAISDIGLNNQQIKQQVIDRVHVFKLIEEILLENNVLILNIDSSRTVKENADLILVFLNSLEN